jgi:hypothetical protein
MLTRALFASLAVCATFLLSGCTSCCHHRPAPAVVGSAPIATPGCSTCGPGGIAPGGVGPGPVVPPAPTPVGTSFYSTGAYAPRY